MTTDKADGGMDLNLEGEVGGVLAQVDVLAADQRFTLSCSREMALLALMERTGYNIVQENGQRKYGGPPPGWEGVPPPRGCEIFVGKLPRDMYEDELVPLFETAGTIYEFRLMMEFSGDNRGYAFVMYTNRDDAHRAIAMLDNFEVRPRKFIGVCVSLDNCRLFIGSIPRDKRKDEILEEMRKVTDGVRDVIMYPSSTDKSRNRGFAFIEYESHKAAAMARRKLIPGSFLLWGQTIQVDWAEPERDVDEKVLQQVKALYVRNLMLSTTDETLLHEFSRFKPGCVERIKKLPNYAFIHYRCREDAEEALRLMNGALIDGATVEVMLAKPAGVKDRNSKRNSGRGYLRSGIPAGGGAVERGLPLRSHVGSPVSSLAGGNADSCVFPLLPETPLAPTSLLALKLSQISSAVALLDFYCHKHCWSPPEYQLYSTPGQDGTPLLLYKVVIPSTQSSFIPDKLCVLLNDAKEVAAQNALWNLDSSLMNEASSEPPGSPSPPLSISSSSPSPPGLVVCGSSSFTSCPPLPAPPVASVLSPLSTFTPPASQPQRLFFSPPSPFY